MTADAPRDFPQLPETIQKIHIIGVCGTGMGSLAAMLKERGFDVRGSDAGAYPPMSDWLESQNIPLMRGYNASNLDWNPDLVVIGNVCRAEYADAVATRERNIPYISFPEALRHFFMTATRNLVITGTHGKTTTTSMLAWLATEAGRDPSFMVGGITGNFQSNYRLGNGEIFVVEGDEYDTAYFDKVPKFWHYAPTRVVINNLEYDHADIYPDVQAIEHVFERLVMLIPPNGSLWVNGDDPRALKVAGHAHCPTKTFGLGAENNLRAVDIAYGEQTTCTVLLDDESLGAFELNTLGEFNVRNMLGTIAMGLDENISIAQMKEAFKTFKATKKRQELIGEINNISVFDDFAHHPTAVEATIIALKNRFPTRKLWAIFEAKSNTSRRRVFQNEYPKGFQHADHVVLSRPFQKNDNLPPEMQLDIEQLAQSIRELGPPTELIPDVDDIVAFVAQHAQPGDVIVGLSGSAFDGLHLKIIHALEKRFA